MSRLPTVGGDDNTWGDVLNDFLGVEHNVDGTQKTLPLTKGGTGGTTAASARTNLGAEASANKGIAGGYAPLDGTGKVPAGNLPAGGGGSTDVNAVHKGDLVYNVKDYGAVGNGTTDDTAAIQAALNALGTVGGIVFFPIGVYKVTSTITCSKDAVILLGQGGRAVGESINSLRGSVLLAATGITMMRFDGGSGVGQSGPTFIDLNFVETSDGNTAILLEIKLMNNWTVRNCSFRAGAEGLRINSDNLTWGGSTSGGDASWGIVDQCIFRNNTKGISVPYTGGFVVLGGNFLGTTGTTSIYANGGSQRRYIGAKFDNGDTGIYDKGGQVLIEGCEMEAQTVDCVRLGGNNLADDGEYQKVINSHFDPTSGVGANVIHLESGVRRPPLLKNNSFVNITATWIKDDAGIGYRREDADGYFAYMQSFSPTTSSTLLDAEMDVCLFDISGASGSGLTVKLPTVSGARQSLKGKRFTVKNKGASGTISLVGNSSETIDGSASVSIPARNSRVVFCDGTNWQIEAGWSG